MLDSRIPDLNLLVALEALLAERNVTKAARRLAISQPALSARLKRLRDLLGDELLVPTQRGMVPTARALELEEPLREALERLREVMRERAPFDPSTAETTVCMAASDYVQTSVLVPFMATLRTEASDLRVAWHHLDGGRLYEWMESGEVDLALMTPHTAPDRLRTRALFDETYVLIVRREHPAARRMDLDAYCALDHVVVSPRGGGFEGATDIALAGLGRKRRVVLSAPSFLPVPEIVARSDMVAAVPRRLVSNHDERLTVHEPPFVLPGFSIAMVWHERTTSSPAQGWLRDRLVRMEAERRS